MAAQLQPVDQASSTPVLHPIPPDFSLWRPYFRPDGTLSAYPQPLYVSTWTSEYQFHSVITQVQPSTPQLFDPQLLVLHCPLHILLNLFDRIQTTQLRIIASTHSVPYRGLTKFQLKGDLQRHICDHSCQWVATAFSRRPDTQDRAVRIMSMPSLSNNRDVAMKDAQDDNTSPSPLRHLRPIGNERRLNIISQWQQEMDPERFFKKPCAACSILVVTRELIVVNSTEIDLTLLRNDQLPPSLQPESYAFHEYDRAILDPFGLEDREHKAGLRLCKTCHSELSRGKMPRLALANWLYYARDRLPINVRKAFASMSIFEKALISRARTNSLLCRFTGIEDDFTEDTPFLPGKRHIRGNIISTPRDTITINNVLPPSPETIADSLCAILVASKRPTKKTLDKLTPIMVRKSRIKLLIQFLIDNNPHYSTSQSFRGFSSEHLDGLFSGSKDIGVPASVTIGVLPLNEAINSVTEDYTGRLSDLEGMYMENVSYTLGDRSATSYEEMKYQAMQHCLAKKPFLHSRSGSEPLPDISNPNWLSWAHPNADPFGIGGFHDPRRTRPISMEVQLRHLLRVRDPFFETDPEIAFDVYNVIRKAAVNTSLQFNVPISSYAGLVKNMSNLDVRHISHLRDKFRRNPTYVPVTDDERHILRIMNSITPVARNIPGSASEKIRMRNEIRAMIAQRGSPTLFITVNPCDLYHPLVSVLATRASSASDLEPLLALTSQNRGELAVLHPAACAEFFDTTIRAFIRIILKQGSRDGPGIFGHCTAHYGAVEAQGKGSLHCHILVWLRDHAPPESLESALKTSPEYRTALVHWLDSIVDSGFIGSRSRLNTTSDGGEREVIRKGEPHPITAIQPTPDNSPAQFEVDFAEYVDDLLTRFNWHKHTGTCWKYLRPQDGRTDANCRFGMDGTTSQETTVDDTSGTISIRRRHPRMTHYNPTATFLLRCNTDIKFIGSGSDAKAFLYYVTDYITKAPLSMHAGLTALSYAIRQGDAKGLLDGGTANERDNKRVMTIAINSMLGHQEISHPQVMNFILGGGERYTSERFQTINWGEAIRYIEQCTGIGRRTFGLQQYGETPPELQLCISSENGRMSASNLLLDYIYRPNSQPYDSMGLYRHIVRTTKKQLRLGPHTETSPHPKNSRPFSSSDHPQFLSHHLTLRTIEVVPVLLGPAIPRRMGNDTEKEEWSRAMCILFKPWRSPTDLIDAHPTWTAAFIHFEPNLDEKDRAVMTNMCLVAEAKQARDENPRHRRHAAVADLHLLEDILETAPAHSQENVYSATCHPMFMDIDDDNGVHQTHRNLEDVLGPSWISDPFNICHPFATQYDQRSVNTANPLVSPHNPTSAEHAELHDTEDTIILQQKFMRKCRLRTLAKSDDDQVETITHNPSKNTAPPATFVTTLASNDSRANCLTVVEKWNEARDLAVSRRLLENAEQLRAFITIANHIIEGGPQLLMYIGGKGGTGKSYLIDTVVDLFRRLQRESEIRLGAYTGIAASLIGGNTLHSILSIGSTFSKGKGTTTTKRLTAEWKSVKYLVIDEISMVGAQFFATISSKLKLAKGDDRRECLKNFGGINMILLGDFFQLSPPKEPSLYAYRLVRSPTFLEAKNNAGIEAVSGAYLWRQFTTVVNLQITKRQEGDMTYANILDKIRTRTCVDKSGAQITINGRTIVEHLRRREISQVAALEPQSLSKFRDAPVIVGNREIRDALNAVMLTAHASRLGEEVNLYYSTDLIRGERARHPASEYLWNLPSTATKDAFGILPLFKGMKVMITENISVPFKIVNGSEGTITHIRFATNADGKRTATVVYVRISGRGSAICAPGTEPGVVPIFPTPSTVSRPVRMGDTYAKTFSRRQVPIVPSYAYTDYKSQGRTLERAIVDIVSCTKPQGVYVMLSRVKSLDGLMILRSFPTHKVLQELSGELREELQRLDALDKIHRENHGTDMSNFMAGIQNVL